MTTMKDGEGESELVEDNWRERNLKSTATTFWTSATVFAGRAHYPQIAFNDCDDEAHLPKSLANPAEPTPQER